MKSGWQPKTLGEVCATIQDGAHESPKQKFDGPGEGRFLYITSKNIRNNYLDLGNVSYVEEDFHNRIYPRCKPSLGDVLLTKDGANTGNVTLNTLDEPFSLLSSVCLIKTKPDALQPAFLSYYIQSPNGLKSITGQMTGAAIKRIILHDIKLAEIPLPPLLEQQRIVGLLDEAFAGLATAKANAEKNLQNARALFEIHLQSVFTQRGKGWVVKKLGEVCAFRSGTTLPRGLEKPSGEIPYLKVADMNISENLNGVTCSSRYVNRKDVNTSNLFPIGTTIFPKRGGAILTNKKRFTERVICADLNIMGVTPQSGLLPEFLFNFFLQLDLREINNGSSIPQINNYSIEPLLIPFPISTAEQQAIVTKLNSLSEETQRLANVYKCKLIALETLKKSLLHRAFSGAL